MIATQGVRISSSKSVSTRLCRPCGGRGRRLRRRRASAIQADLPFCSLFLLAPTSRYSRRGGDVAFIRLVRTSRSHARVDRFTGVAYGASRAQSICAVPSAPGPRENQHRVQQATEDSGTPGSTSDATVRVFHRRRGPRGARQHRIIRRT